VVLFNDKPLGKAGEEVQDVGVLPVKLADIVVIAEFCVNEKGDPT